MTLTDRTILALRAEYDRLAATVAGATDQQLTQQSGAAEWTVADALSHLGSGAEIALATLRAGQGAGPAPDEDFNHAVWDRWNAAAPRDQLTAAIEQNAALLTAFEALTAEERGSAEVPVSYQPTPLAVGTYAALRLNETAQHGWDVRVGLDPAAAIGPDSAPVLFEHFATDLSFMLGFVSKADQLSEPVVLDIDGTGFGLLVNDTVGVTASVENPTATFAGPFEAALRLVAGRLAPRHTPDAVAVTGNVTLDELRRVFPGY